MRRRALWLSYDSSYGCIKCCIWVPMSSILCPYHMMCLCCSYVGLMVLMICVLFWCSFGIMISSDDLMMFLWFPYYSIWFPMVFLWCSYVVLYGMSMMFLCCPLIFFCNCMISATFLIYLWFFVCFHDFIWFSN